MTATPVLGATDLVDGQAIPEASVNEIIRLLEQGAQQLNVKDKDLATPPVSPAAGDAYLVPASPTGAWTGKADNVAWYLSGTGWRFIPPRTGMRAEVNDEGLIYRYSGSAWVATSGAVVSSLTMTASATIAAGNFVNVHNSSGAKIRKADATDDTKPVDGFAPAGIASSGSGTVQGPGTLVSGLSGLTPGATYYLDTTPGAITATAPSSAGNLVQIVGRAVSATQLFFNPQPGVTL